MQSEKYIHHLFAAIFEMFDAMGKSLKREYDFIDQQPNRSDKVLAAKERQISTLEDLRLTFDQVYDELVSEGKENFKLTACLLFYGVSFSEVEQFTSNSSVGIQHHIEEHIKKGVIQVPEKIRPLLSSEAVEKTWLDHFETDLRAAETKAPKELKEVKTSNRPVLGIENLKKLIQTKTAA